MYFFCKAELTACAELCVFVLFKEKSRTLPTVWDTTVSACLTDLNELLPKPFGVGTSGFSLFFISIYFLISLFPFSTFLLVFLIWCSTVTLHREATNHNNSNKQFWVFKTQILKSLLTSISHSFFDLLFLVFSLFFLSLIANMQNTKQKNCRFIFVDAMIYSHHNNSLNMFRNVIFTDSYEKKWTLNNCPCFCSAVDLG